ncbi:hypothetical protein B0H14DRAFT_2853701, partial [Mycena olivaceomarginata]
MRTLGVVHAYVGVFPSLLSLPPRLSLRPCFPFMHSVSVSLSCFTDLVRFEPLGALWSTGPLGERPFAAKDR